VLACLKVLIPFLSKGYWYCFAINNRGKTIAAYAPDMPSNVAVATHDWLEVVGLKLVSSIREISVGGGGNLCAQADRWDFICDNVQSLHNFGNDGFDVCVFALLFDGFRFRNEITLGQKTEFLNHSLMAWNAQTM